MTRGTRIMLGAGALAFALVGGGWSAGAVPDKKDPHPAKTKIEQAIPDYECQLPNDAWKIPFKDEQPIRFVNRAQSPAEWDKLPAFWNETTERTTDPRTGQEVVRKAVTIRVPLGLTTNPPVPAENPLTVAKWRLGKQLYFDPILSSDASVACASCHAPQRGFTDNAPFSTGIRGLRGGMSAPTVFNSAYHGRQFWDGRAASLEDQAQGPVQNPVEMFDGTGHAWNRVIERLRRRPEYVRQFRLVFGTEPTRDGAAKAVAAYERTVLSGNSLHDRAELAMRKRVEDEETGKFEFKAKDYETVLRQALAHKDTAALKALGLDPARDAGRVGEVARAIHNGRSLFFGKARCNSCHVGDNFTDNQFHNLGVGVKDGKLTAALLGRYASLPTGHKDEALAGAFKTPTLRHLLGTAPYMHDGSEKTLEQVVEFYDRGGNANEYLDAKMRDYEAEKAALRGGSPVARPVVPLKLNLTPQEKKDLVLFLRALQGDPADPVVADPHKLPG